MVTSCPHCGISINGSNSSSENGGKRQENASLNNNLAEMPMGNSIYANVEHVENERGDYVADNVQEERYIIKKYISIAIVFVLLIVGGVWWYLNSSKGEETINVEGKKEEVAAREQYEVEMPSILKLGTLFDDLVEGRSTALLDYGFIMEDRQTQMQMSEYYDEDDPNAYYEVVKDVYYMKYKRGDNDGYMRANYVYAQNYGDPRMTIECDADSWEQLLLYAEHSLKKDYNNTFVLGNSYVTFEENGVINITEECSVSWNE